MLSKIVLFAALSLASSLKLEDRFTHWIDEFRIEIQNTEHREHVFANWVFNDKYIEESNNKNLTYILGHNHFSGMNSEEFSESLKYSAGDFVGKINRDKIKSTIEEVKCLSQCVKHYDTHHKLDTIGCVTECLQSKLTGVLQSVPDSVNWVEKGAVTPVKNQGQCGSCWSFSTTGALEGAYFTTYGQLPSFSEQQLVDCDNRQNGGKDMGCNGGLMDNAFKWIEKNGGLCTEDEYPYFSGDTKKPGSCKTSCAVVDDSKITSFVDVKTSDNDMMTALSQQPVSIAIQADQKDFQLYKSGVFTGDCGTQLDHGVLAVGYGSLNGQDYYLVKNSWGTTWGDNGYIMLGRGTEFNKGNGQCGMLMQPSYPKL